MTWVKDSDDVYDDELLWEADVIPSMLWSAGMRECAKRDGDGVLSPKLIADARTKFKTPIRASAVTVLTDLGLWHDEAAMKRCRACSEMEPPPPSSLPSPAHRFIHRWVDHLLDEKGKNDRLHRKIQQARDALRKGKHKDLAGKVRARDNNECQYCGVVTRWEDRKAGDKRSADLGEFDHVDPFAEELNTYGNVVVACKGCNGGAGGKGQRTPAQWHAAGGLLLRRPVDETTDPSWVDPRYFSDPDAENHRSNGGSPRVARDSGPGPDPIKADQGSGAGHHRSGPETRVPVPSTNGESQ